MPEPTINDAELGNLIWDPEVDRWTGRTEVAPGLTLDVSICPDGFEREAVLANARGTLRLVRESVGRLGHFIAQELLDEYR